MENAKVYGIDLGTTYSVIATLDDHGMPKVIENLDDSSNFLASAVYFSEGSDPVVGEMAKKQKDFEPKRVVEFVKRYIGKADAPTYEFEGVKYDPITISSLILKRMKSYAEAQGEDVKDVVITCPAYFGNEEEAATRQAGLIAGFNVMNIVHEPVAAAINYCAREFNENRKIMVYDLGGGTFDVTLFDFIVDENGKTQIDVLKTDGDDRLGGIDWDDRMFHYICEKFANENGISESEIDSETIDTFKALVEQTKRDLSQLDKKAIQFKVDGEKQRLDLTRAEFAEKTKDLVERTLDFVHRLLSDVNLDTKDVDLVLLVGGSTFMPMIKAAVENLFPGKVRLEEPNLAVAKGAALAAAIEWNEQFRKQKVDSTTLDPIQPGSTNNADTPKGPIDIPGPIMPPKNKLTRSLGPAVFVQDESYMIDNLLLVGDEIPAESERVYGTRIDNASEIVVNVYENVSKDAHVTPCSDPDGNFQYTDPALKVKHIGEVHLQLPPNTPKGSPIRVVFRSTTMGLEVTAVNVETGESANARIESANTLNNEELEKAIKRFEGIQTSGQI